MVFQANQLDGAHLPPWVKGVAVHAFAGDRDFQRYGANHAVGATGDMVDYLFARVEDGVGPDQAFNHLRWGGQLIVADTDIQRIAGCRKQFDQHPAFRVDVGEDSVRVGNRFLGFNWFGKRWHYFVARKLLMLRPGETTDRFVFDVALTPARHKGRDKTAGGYVVRKRVPSHRSVVTRLMERCPGADMEKVAERAHKLVDHVFPVFLSREAAFLQLLQRDLPPAYRKRVPAPMGVIKDDRGLVRELHIQWLRVGGPVLTQLQFAVQAAELLTALHEEARIVHLDLRLDNVVVTDAGVGFIDFGSAVRIDEDLSKSHMLTALFDEMMSTSQIQKLLGKMKRSGRVTSKLLINAHQRVDPAADLFYLGMQIARPTSNPQLRPLIRHDEGSTEDVAIKHLTEELLRPKDPAKPTIRCARDLLAALTHIETQQLRNTHSKQPHGADAAREARAKSPAVQHGQPVAEPLALHV